MNINLIFSITQKAHIVTSEAIVTYINNANKKQINNALSYMEL